MRRWLWSLCLIAVLPTQGHAVIYRCQSLQGEISFQETPCFEKGKERQITLAPSKGGKSRQQASDNKVRQKSLLKRKKRYDSRLKQQKLLKKKQVKAIKKHRQIALRNQKKCQKVKESIKKMNSTLRRGCTVKRGEQIKRRLAEHQVLRKQYCYG